VLRDTIDMSARASDSSGIDQESPSGDDRSVLTLDFRELVQRSLGSDHSLVEVDLGLLDGVCVLRLTDAESPRFLKDSTSWPAEVVLRSESDWLGRIELDLIGDLVLSFGTSDSKRSNIFNRFYPLGESPHLPRFGEDILVTSAMHDVAVVVGGFPPQNITIGELIIGYKRGFQDDGTQVLRVAGRHLASLNLLSSPRRGQVGDLSVANLTVPEACEVLDLRRPLGMDTADYRRVEIGMIRRSAGSLPLRLNLDGPCRVDHLPAGCHVVADGDMADFRIGSEDVSGSATDLSFSGSRLRLVAGLIDGLALNDVDRLEVGLDPPGEDEARPEFYYARYDQLPYGAHITGASGSAKLAHFNHGANVDGSISRGLGITEVFVHEEAEVTGLRAGALDLESILRLSSAKRLGLWVDPKTSKATRMFNKEAGDARQTSAAAIDRLADKRRHLLRLAENSAQSGHVLAVLREAEKDARRRCPATGPRERWLLWLSRTFIGYGERIGWPLGVGAGLLLLLASCQVGWGRWSTTSWWSGFGDHHRYQRAIEFCLPGLNWLGGNGIPGLWGIFAKVVSVVFVAGSLSAARRVLRRGD
jgi:hypothetical protein